MEKEKYYIFCSDRATREGWYEEFDTIEKAIEYIDEHYVESELLVKGTEIEFDRNCIKTNIQFVNFYKELKGQTK